MEENPNIRDSKEIFTFDCFRNGTNGSRDSKNNDPSEGFIPKDFKQKEILKRRMLYNMSNDTNRIFIPTFIYSCFFCAGLFNWNTKGCFCYFPMPNRALRNPLRKQK